MIAITAERFGELLAAEARLAEATDAGAGPHMCQYADRLAEVEAERDALRYVDKAHTIVMRRCDEAEARLAVTQTKVANAIGSFCECHSEHRPCMFCEVRAVLAAVDGPAESYGAVMKTSEPDAELCDNPPADHIALFDGPAEGSDRG